MKRVSILVPVYGAELYIEQCARSLFAQSYPWCEFIFVDDASTDESLARLKSVAAEYKDLTHRIIIVELPQNGGVAAARNAALDAASGDYILFVDADDWIDTQIVERLVMCAIETDADICNAWCQSVTSSGELQHTPMNWLPRKEAHLRALIAQSHVVPNHVRGMLFSRALFEEHHLRFTPGVDFGEDYSLLPQIIYFAERLSTLRQYLYYYRAENEGSYMNNIGERHIRNYVEAQAIVSRFMESLPDAAHYAHALTLGRINIKKWIFKRGTTPKQYNKQLFGTEQPSIGSPLLHLYNRAIDGGNHNVIKLFSIAINLRTWIAMLVRLVFSDNNDSL